MIHPAYKIDGPALVSFSGGRTSAYMLHQILAAHDGKLPDDVHVTFANTGKEREETLRFVHECGSRWGVRIRWVEWRPPPERFEEVGFNSASRNGEPFAALIRSKQYLPNGNMRFCTTELKIRPMRDFARALGWERWVNVIGLRYDEGRRVLKAIDRSESGKDPWRNALPLSKAKVTKADVKGFWEKQPFDLGLRDYEGNCDLCFLKSKAKLAALVRENPGMADWWIEQEKALGHTFEHSYAALAEFIDRQGFLFDDGEEYDTECGLHCGGDDAEAA